jgi:hypothetical protein
VFGHVLGVLRLGLRLWFGTVDPGDSNWIMRLVVYSHFLHFIFFTFACCVAVIFGVRPAPTSRDLLSVGITQR